VIVRQRKAVWRFASHRIPENLFLDCAGKAKRRRRFSMPRSLEEEKRGTFVQPFTDIKRLAPTAHLY